MTPRAVDAIRSHVGEAEQRDRLARVEGALAAGEDDPRRMRPLLVRLLALLEPLLAAASLDVVSLRLVEEARLEVLTGDMVEAERRTALAVEARRFGKLLGVLEEEGEAVNATRDVPW